MENPNSILNKAKQIVKGQIAVLSNANEDIREERLKVCKACPLYKEDGVLSRAYCDPTKYINPITKEVLPSTHPFSPYEKSVFFQGCGCTLNNNGSGVSEKTRVVGAGNTCPSKQWNNQEILYFRINVPKNYEIEINPTLEIQDNTKKIEVQKRRTLISSIQKNGITLAAYSQNINLSLKSISHKDIVKKYTYLTTIYDINRANIYSVYYTPSSILLYDVYDNILSYHSSSRDFESNTKLSNETLQLHPVLSFLNIQNNFNKFMYKSINQFKEELSLPPTK